MVAVVEYAEYLAEIRKAVCRHCPERSLDPPPYGVRCGHCEVALRLPELVEMIRDVGTASGDCACLRGDLPDVLVGAVEEADERREQREQVRRCMARQPRKGKVPVVEMIRAYEAATGTVIGCD